MRAKYIIFDDNGIPIPIVFSPLIQHQQFANFKPISAGFCQRLASENVWVCWGESVSLGLKSKGITDADVLNKYLCYDA